MARFVDNILLRTNDSSGPKGAEKRVYLWSAGPVSVTAPIQRTHNVQSAGHFDSRDHPDSAAAKCDEWDTVRGSTPDINATR